MNDKYIIKYAIQKGSIKINNILKNVYFVSKCYLISNTIHYMEDPITNTYEVVFPYNLNNLQNNMFDITIFKEKIIPIVKQNERDGFYNQIYNNTSSVFYVFDNFEDAKIASNYANQELGLDYDTLKTIDDYEFVIEDQTKDMIITKDEDIRSR